jgi:ribosomal protein S18 acetylase RimI-like enzyme
MRVFLEDTLMLEIKPLLPDQWLLLKEVRLRALADAPEAFSTTLAQARQYSEEDWQERARRFITHPPATSCIAFMDGAPCGMINCFLTEADNPAGARSAEMTAFWVASESRGQGVGEALVVSAAHWANTRGVTMLQAWVVEDNCRAIGFYRKVGFQTTDLRQPYEPDPAKQIILLTKNRAI